MKPLTRIFSPIMTAIRTAVAYPLLALQLLFVLFILELPFWIADRFFARNRGDAFYRAQRGVARWFLRLYPFGWQQRVNVRADAFPGPCVIVCNHQSVLDTFIAMLLPVNARFFVRPESLRIPLMGELNKLARHMRDGSSAARDSADGPSVAAPAALDWLSRGVSVVMFPEGEPGTDGEIKPFNASAFELAKEAGVPVVPVVINGSGACIKPGSPVVRHPDITLKVLPAVSVADAADAAARVRGQMIAELAVLRSAGRRQGIPVVHGWMTRLAGLAIGLVLGAAACLSIYVDNFCMLEPPEFDGDRGLAQSEIQQVRLGDRPVQVLGESWRRQRDGIHELGIAGSPWERGYANAMLTPELVEAQERHLYRTAREFLPHDVPFWLVRQLVTVQNRTLPRHVSADEQIEILGLAEGSVDHFAELGWPLYHRVMSYHAAHDISHILVDNPLLSRRDLVGCTGFAAWGDATRGGELWVARNFDWEAGEVFDRDKCVLYVWPDEGIPYVHVAWAGMAGAVTGMNAEGLSIHLNAARTDETRFGRIGTPVSLLVKRVLAEARSIDEAYTIIREARVAVSDSYLVASRAEGRAVVIEKSPLHCVLREAEKPGLVLQSNHFHGEAWKGDPVHREQMERATTLYRMQRLTELTESRYGSIDAAACLAILRDRAGRGGKQIGFGNRNAIDAGICAHSVIMNVSSGEMWVSAGPHTLGEYVYVPVLAMLQAGPAGAVRTRIDAGRNLPGETMATASNLAEFRRQLELARVNVAAENVSGLSANVRSLRNLNPLSFETAYFQGRLAWLNSEYAQAAGFFEAALERDPHYEATREQIRVWLNRARMRSGQE